MCGSEKEKRKRRGPALCAFVSEGSVFDDFRVF